MVVSSKTKKELSPNNTFVEYVLLPFTGINDIVRFDYKIFIGVCKIWQIGGGVCRFSVRPPVGFTSSNNSAGSPYLEGPPTAVQGALPLYVLDSNPAFSFSLTYPQDFVHPIWTKSIWISATTISNCYVAWEYKVPDK